MPRPNHSWKLCRPGEKFIFGSIIHAQRDKPKGNFGEITVKGGQHVGIYRANLNSIERIIGRALKPGDGWNLFIREDLHVERLYIGPHKIYPKVDDVSGQIVPIILTVKRMFIPYDPQQAFGFVHPWERQGTCERIASFPTKLKVL